MKLRQKLAAVLAASIVATSLPVVTMAASDNTLTHGVIVEQKDTPVQAGGLKINMKDAVDATGAMFFVNLDNAEWNIPSSVTTTVDNLEITYKANSKKELQVSVKSTDSNAAQKDFTLPLNVKLTGGDATVAINGNASVISDMAPVVFAKTSDAKANVSVNKVASIYDIGTVGEVTVEESLKGTLTAGTTAEDRTIELTLENTEFEFTSTNAGIELSKGFSGINTSDITVSYGQDSQGNADKQVLKVTLPQKAASDLVAPGRITFKGLAVKAKNPTVGDINIQVSGKKVNTTSVKVAEVKGFGNSIVMKNDKVVEMVAGRQSKVTFSIKENVNDSILGNRNVEVSLDKGYLTNTNAANQTLNPTVKLNGVTLDSDAVTAMNIAPITDRDGYVTGFSFQTPANLDSVKADEITFADMPIYAPLTVEGDITIKAEGRALAEESTTTAVTIKAPVEVKTEAMTLKVGLKDQKGGKITVKETDKGMLAVRDIEIELPEEAAMQFSNKSEHKPVVKVVEGDLQLGDWKVKNNKLVIAVKRASKEASTIEISDLVVSTDRTLPQGTYDAVIKGEAFVKTADQIMDTKPSTTVANEEKNTIKVEDFFVVSTPNTEDIGSNGLKKGTSTFVIGEKSYTVNGAKNEMDVAPYISEGRTMMPLRFVSNALGIDSQNIFFANKNITIIAGNKTISMEIGSKIVKLNGTPIRVMETAPIIKDNRTFIPVREVASILGVEAKWDQETKTATFINE